MLFPDAPSYARYALYPLYPVRAIDVIDISSAAHQGFVLPLLLAAAHADKTVRMRNTTTPTPLIIPRLTNDGVVKRDIEIPFFIIYLVTYHSAF